MYSIPESVGDGSRRGVTVESRLHLSALLREQRSLRESVAKAWGSKKSYSLNFPRRCAQDLRYTTSSISYQFRARRKVPGDCPAGRLSAAHMTIFIDSARSALISGRPKSRERARLFSSPTWNSDFFAISLRRQVSLSLVTNSCVQFGATKTEYSPGPWMFMCIIFVGNSSSILKSPN
jgi:hypothetical protein